MNLDRSSPGQGEGKATRTTDNRWMATPSGTSLVGVAPLSSRRYGRVQLCATVAASVLCLLYLVLPRSLVLEREVFIYVGVEALTVVAIVVGVRWYAPAARAAWLAFAAGIAFWT